MSATMAEEEVAALRREVTRLNGEVEALKRDPEQEAELDRIAKEAFEGPPPTKVGVGLFDRAIHEALVAAADRAHDALCVILGLEAGSDIADEVCKAIVAERVPEVPDGAEGSGEVPNE